MTKKLIYVFSVAMTVGKDLLVTSVRSTRAVLMANAAQLTHVNVIVVGEVTYAILT